MPGLHAFNAGWHRCLLPSKRGGCTCALHQQPGSPVWKAAAVYIPAAIRRNSQACQAGSLAMCNLAYSLSRSKLPHLRATGTSNLGRV